MLVVYYILPSSQKLCPQSWNEGNSRCKVFKSTQKASSIGYKSNLANTSTISQFLRCLILLSKIYFGSTCSDPSSQSLELSYKT